MTPSGHLSDHLSNIYCIHYIQGSHIYTLALFLPAALVVYFRISTTELILYVRLMFLDQICETLNFSRCASPSTWNPENTTKKWQIHNCFKSISVKPSVCFAYNMNLFICVSVASGFFCMYTWSIVRTCNREQYCTVTHWTSFSKPYLYIFWSDLSGQRRLFGS